MSEITIVDNTRLEAVATCDLKAVLAHVWGYRGREENIYARAGQAVHVGLKEFFRTKGDIEAAMVALSADYWEFAKENIASDDRLSWENVSTILHEYFVQHPIEKFPFVPIEGSEETAVVLPFAEGFEYYSLLDLAGYEKSIGGTYVIDHKTTGNITGWWEKKFRIGSQLSGYIWSLAQQRGEVVVGAYVNAVELSKLPEIRYKKDGGEYKCRKHKAVYSECRRMHAKWQLLVTIRTPEMIEKWKIDALAHAKRFKALQQAFGHSIELLPFVSQQGTFNNGCTFCEFRDFCAAERRPELVENMLIHSPWLPWEGVR